MLGKLVNSIEKYFSQYSNSIISNTAYILVTIIVPLQLVVCIKLVGYSGVPYALTFGMLLKSVITFLFVSVPIFIGHIAKVKGFKHYAFYLSKKDIIPLFIRGVAGNGCAFLFFIISEHMYVNDLLLVSCLTPVAVGLISKLYLKYKIHNEFFIWLLICIAGLFIVVFGEGKFEIRRGYHFGLLFVIFFAISSILLYKYDRSYKVLEIFDSLNFTIPIWIILFFGYEYIRGIDFIAKSSDMFFSINGIIVFVSILIFETLIFLLCILGNRFAKNPVMVHVINFLQVIWSVPLSYFFLAEKIRIQDFIGGSVMLYGVYKIVQLVYGNKSKDEKISKLRSV